MSSQLNQDDASGKRRRRATAAVNPVPNSEDRIHHNPKRRNAGRSLEEEEEGDLSLSDTFMGEDEVDEEMPTLTLEEEDCPGRTLTSLHERSADEDPLSSDAEDVSDDVVDLHHAWCSDKFYMADFLLWQSRVKDQIFGSIQELEQALTAWALGCIRIIANGKLKALMKVSDERPFEIQSVAALRDYHVALQYKPRKGRRTACLNRMVNLTSILTTDERFILRDVTWIPTHRWVSEVADERLRSLLRNKRVLNTFHPWQAIRIEDEAIDMHLIEPILHHIKIVWCDADEEVYQYLLAKFSFAMKYPHAKDDILVVLHGKGGEGKSSIFHLFSDYIFGQKNSAYFDGLSDVATWSQCIEHVKLCILEELHGEQSNGKLMDSLKNIIDAKVLMGRRKHQDAKPFRNFTLVFACSNNEGCMYLKDKGINRRVLMLKVNGETVTSEYLARLFKCLNQDVGNHLFSYLLRMHPDWSQDDHYQYLQHHKPMTAYQADVLDKCAPKHVQFYNELVSGELVLEFRYYKCERSHAYSNHKLLFVRFQKFVSESGGPVTSRMTAAQFRKKMVQLGFKIDADRVVQIQGERGTYMELPDSVQLAMDNRIHKETEARDVRLSTNGLR